MKYYGCLDNKREKQPTSSWLGGENTCPAWYYSDSECFQMAWTRQTELKSALGLNFFVWSIRLKRHQWQWTQSHEDQHQNGF